MGYLLARRALVFASCLLGCGGDGGDGATSDAAHDGPAVDGGNPDGGATDGSTGDAMDSSASVDGDSATDDSGADGATGDGGSGDRALYRWDYTVHNGESNYGNGVATTSNGHIYLTGTHGADHDFGGGERPAGTFASGFVVHLDEEGNYQWDNSLRNAYHYAIAVDPSGRAYVVGETGTSSAWEGDVEIIISSQTQYVMGFDEDGARRWIYTFEGEREERTKIAAASSGNVYVAGHIGDDTDLGGGLREAPAEFLLALTSDGEYRWDRTMPGSSGTRDLVVDGNENIYHTFGFGGTQDFGGGGRDSGDGGAAIVSRDSDGNYRWDRNLERGFPMRLAVTAGGDLYFMTHLYAPYDFGGGERTRVGAGDGIVVALDQDGNYRWDHQSAIRDGDDYQAVGVDQAGNVYVVGDYLNPDSVGGPELPNFGLSDLYLISLTPEGEYRWDHPWGSDKSELDYMYLSGSTPNRVVVAGSYNNQTDFGGGPRDSGRKGAFVFSMY